MALLRATPEDFRLGEILSSAAASARPELNLDRQWVDWGVSYVVIGISWLEPVEVGEIYPYLGFNFSNIFYILQDPRLCLWERDFSCTQTFWVMITHWLALTEW